MLNHNFPMKINPLNSLNSITWLSQSSNSQNNFRSSSHAFISLTCIRKGSQPQLWSMWWQSIGTESKVVLMYWSQRIMFLLGLRTCLQLCFAQTQSPSFRRICSSQRLNAYCLVPCDLWSYWKLISSYAFPWCQPLKSLTINGRRELQTNK